MLKTIDEKFYRQLGIELGNIRRSKGMSLRDVAKKTGYSRTLIDQWELGQRRIKNEQYELLCSALDVSSSLKIEITVGFTK